MSKNDPIPNLFDMNPNERIVYYAEHLDELKGKPGPISCPGCEEQEAFALMDKVLIRIYDCCPYCIDPEFYDAPEMATVFELIQLL